MKKQADELLLSTPAQEDYLLAVPDLRLKALA